MIEDFLEYLRVEKQYSPHTVEAYGRDLRQFDDWIGSGTLDHPAAVRPSDVRSWIGDLADNGHSPATLRRKAQSLRAFFHRLHQTGLLQMNPTTDIILPKKRRHLPNFIKEAEIESLLSGRTPESGSPDEDSFHAARTHIVLTILYSLGLRQAELTGLTDGDIDYARGEIRVTGKRNKQRVLPMPGELADEISAWQSLRDRKYPDLREPRFLIAGPHGRISRMTFYNMVRNGLDGISAGRKSPHTLRHTFATSMINHGADLDAVREILGHESLATTQIYTHLSVRELMRDYRQAHPRGEKQDG